MKLARPVLFLALTALLATGAQASVPSASAPVALDHAPSLSSASVSAALDVTALEPLDEAPRFEPGEASLLVEPRAESFHLDGVALLSEEPRRALPLSYPETRVRGFDFLGQEVVGVIEGVTLELHWGCERFGLGISEGNGVNLYAFVGQRPHEKTDPLGLWGWKDTMALLGIEPDMDEATERQLLRQRREEWERRYGKGTPPGISGGTDSKRDRQAALQNFALESHNRRAYRPVFWTVQVPNTITAVAAPAVGAMASSRQRTAAAELPGFLPAQPPTAPRSGAQILYSDNTVPRGPFLLRDAELPEPVTPLTAPGGLKLLADQSHMARGVHEITLQQSAVAILQARLIDGSYGYYASGNAGDLTPAQRGVLEAAGIPRANIFVGAQYTKEYTRRENHAERIILRNLPEGATPVSWGISWTETHKGEPCGFCRPFVEGAGGDIQQKP